MTRLEQRQAERQSFLNHYRDHVVAMERTAPDGSLAVIFRQPESGARCYLLAFAGTAGKPCKHFAYGTLEAADRDLAAFLESRAAHRAMLAEHKAERSAFRTSLKVGDVLDASWGYDQTNVDYYQVVEVSESGQSVVTRKIAARSVEEGWLTGSCWPLADHFIGEPETHRVLPGDAVKVRDWGVYADKWVPKPNRWSAYA